MAKSSDIIITRTSRANSASASESSSHAEQYPMRVAFSVRSADYYTNLANNLQTHSTARTVVPHAQLNNNAIANISHVVEKVETESVKDDLSDTTDQEFLIFKIDDIDFSGESKSV